MNRHLGRVRTGDEIGRAKHVEKVLIVEPLAAIEDDVDLSVGIEAFEIEEGLETDEFLGLVDALNVRF